MVPSAPQLRILTSSRREQFNLNHSAKKRNFFLFEETAELDDEPLFLAFDHLSGG